jgi:hypothetical protein
MFFLITPSVTLGRVVDFVLSTIAKPGTSKTTVMKDQIEYLSLLLLSSYNAAT